MTETMTPEAAMFFAYKSYFKCPRCGCKLEAYEVFAQLIRGIKKPVCIGCLADALVFMKEDLAPMLDKALENLGGELHRK